MSLVACIGWRNRGWAPHRLFLDAAPVARPVGQSQPWTPAHSPPAPSRGSVADPAHTTYHGRIDGRSRYDTHRIPTRHPRSIDMSHGAVDPEPNRSRSSSSSSSTARKENAPRKAPVITTRRMTEEVKTLALTTNASRESPFVRPGIRSKRSTGTSTGPKDGVAETATPPLVAELDLVRDSSSGRDHIQLTWTVAGQVECCGGGEGRISRAISENTPGPRDITSRACQTRGTCARTDFRGRCEIEISGGCPLATQDCGEECRSRCKA